jgi:soluble lytic murein transglycosylase-like protein
MGGLTGAAVVAAAVMAACPARADVLQIGPQGAVTVYSAPSIFTDEGAKPIARRTTPRVRTGGSAPAPAEVSSVIDEAARRYALPRGLMQALAWQESHFHQAAVSNKGAVGVMQLMPGTARKLGVDPYDLRQNIHGGAAYLSQMLTRYRGDAGLALAAYNAGPGAVDKYGGAPPFKETQQYLSHILTLAPSLAAAARPSSMIIGQ